MDEQSDSDLERAARNAQSMVDPSVFAEFQSLLGPTKAQFWLEELRNDLEENLLSVPVGAERAGPRRADIHRFCGRAGFIGFQIFHAACIDFLEGGETQAAQHRVRTEAEKVCRAIEQLE